MPVIAAFVLPHPPLAIPDVGQGQERGISATIFGYRRVAEKISELAPETIVVVSPHSIMYSDYIHVSPGTHAEGSMSRFGQPQVRVSADYDSDLVTAICEIAEHRGISAGIEGECDPSLDHGTIVPLWFVNERYTSYRLVRCSLSGLPLIDHYRFGQCIADAADRLDRRVAIIASGDLSHKLLDSGPYGFDPAAPVYEERVVSDIASGDFGDLLEFDEALCESAAECGHRSFVEMAGALDGRDVSCELMSHEGPFGVGYATAIVVPGGENPSRRFGDAYLSRKRDSVSRAVESADAHVAIARLGIEATVLGKGRLTSDDPAVRSIIAEHSHQATELESTRAGAFVSIHEHGILRGCIGTIYPVCSTLADEILQNAASASCRDPRFDPITPDELPYLEVSVDVLGAPEPVSSTDELDPVRYGVIVTSGSRRGLLLPNLDGVDTVEEQLSIARRKAGIGPKEDCTIERFEVQRHV